MPRSDDWVSKQGDRTGGRETEATSEAPSIGKVSLVQSRFGPNAPQPTEPNKRTLTEQVVPIQMRGETPDNATAVAPPPTGSGGTPLPPDVRAQMEAALGANFATVRVHVSSYA